jgi:hypothetical protein
VLAAPVGHQCFKAISWRATHVAQRYRAVQLPQFALSNPFDGCESRDVFSAMKAFRISAPKALDHAYTI